MNITSTPTGALIDKYGEADKVEKSAVATKAAIKAALITREGEFKGEGTEFAGALQHPVKTSVKWEAVARRLATDAGLSQKQFQAIVDSNSTLSDYWQFNVKPKVTLL